MNALSNVSSYIRLLPNFMQGRYFVNINFIQAFLNHFKGCYSFMINVGISVSRLKIKHECFVIYGI